MTGRPTPMTGTVELPVSRFPMPVCTAVCILLLACLGSQRAFAQEAADAPRPSASPVRSEDLPRASIPGDYLSWDIPSESRDAITRGLKAGDYETVEEALVRLIGQDPKSQRLLTFLARVFFIDRKPLNCAVALKKAERLEPLKESDRFTLALCYVILKWYDWASEEFSKLEKSNPGNVLYPYWQGRIAYDKYAYAEAIEKFKKSLELDPGFTRAYDNLGLCYQAMSDDESAMKYFEHAVALNRSRLPSSPWPPLNYGMLLLKQGLTDEAEPYLVEAVRLGPGMALAHHQLGVALEKQEKYTDAIDEMKKAVELDPTYPEVHFTLAHVYKQLGNKDRADLEFNTFQKLKQEQSNGENPAPSGQASDNPHR